MGDMASKVTLEIDACLKSQGWTYDVGDEEYRDGKGLVVPGEVVMAALPPDTSWDELAAFEEWKQRNGN